MESKIGILQLDQNEEFRMLVETRELEESPNVMQTGALVKDTVEEMQWFETKLNEEIVELRAATRNSGHDDKNASADKKPVFSTVNRVRRFFEQN